MYWKWAYCMMCECHMIYEDVWLPLLFLGSPGTCACSAYQTLSLVPWSGGVGTIQVTCHVVSLTVVLSQLLYCVSLVPRPLPAFQHSREKQEGLIRDGTWRFTWNQPGIDLILRGSEFCFLAYLASYPGLPMSTHARKIGKAWSIWWCNDYVSATISATCVHGFRKFLNIQALMWVALMSSL